MVNPPLLSGVSLGCGQVALESCALDDCTGGIHRGRARSTDQPLYLLVYNDRMMAVCGRCKQRIEGTR